MLKSFRNSKLVETQGCQWLGKRNMCLTSDRLSLWPVTMLIEYQWPLLPIIQDHNLTGKRVDTCITSQILCVCVCPKEISCDLAPRPIAHSRVGLPTWKSLTTVISKEVKWGIGSLFFPLCNPTVAAATMAVTYFAFFVISECETKNFFSIIL